MPFDQQAFVEAPVSPVARLLKEARALIEKPENWLQCESYAPRGAYCALGALSIADRSGHFCEARNALLDVELRSPKPGFSIALYNDTHSHAEVIALFDAAIEAA